MSSHRIHEKGSFSELIVVQKVEGCHHCAVVQSDEKAESNRGFENCTLNPGHSKFMTVAEFNDYCLPEKIDTFSYNIRKKIQQHVDRTVRVVVSHTSSDRPDTYPHKDIRYPCSEYKGNDTIRRLGTGFVVKCVERTGIITEPCPCMECDSPHNFNRKRYTDFEKVGIVNTNIVVGPRNSPPIKLFKNAHIRFFTKLDKHGDIAEKDEQSYWIANETPTFDLKTGYSRTLYLDYNVTLVPPPDLPVTRSLDPENDNYAWYKIPKGTELVTDRGVIYNVPHDMEFHVDSDFSNIYSRSLSYISYDMASCPGSSGARVIHDCSLSLVTEGSHFGCWQGENFSGLRRPHKPIDLPRYNSRVRVRGRF